MPTLTMLSDPEIFCRFLAAVSNNLVAHLGALIEVAEPSLLDSRDVDEYVLAAGVRLNKPKPFVGLNHFTVPVATSALPVAARRQPRAAAYYPRKEKPAGCEPVPSPLLVRRP
jgi:hypothetical protein